MVKQKPLWYSHFMQKGLKILAIETSCDDTCIAILEAKELKNSISFKSHANVVHSQIIHTNYGGVFPMMAKREHIKNIGPVYKKAVKDAGNPKIDLIVVTTGPGLEPALWVGIVFAQELGEKLGIPVLPVNHMEGHILSILTQKEDTFTYNKDTLQFPMLSLLVSGGHTELVLTKKFGSYKVIGKTRDDAAGEAFDKVARMLGLPYPGGPAISKLAATERKHSVLGGADIFLVKNSSCSRRRAPKSSENTVLSEVVLPRPMIYSKDYDFSFSGLKTAVLYYIRDLPAMPAHAGQAGHGPLTEKTKSEIAREFEDAAIEVLVHKTQKAVAQYKIQTLIVGGGVSANTYLQQQLKKKIKEKSSKTKVHFPVKKLSTDNALMIAIAGFFQYQKNGLPKRKLKLKAVGNMSL
jgi:N6-L-threonylcarbamoyladenine synthase